MPSSRAAGAPRPALSTSRATARASSSLSRTPTSTPPISVLCRMSREQILATTGYGTACCSALGCTSAIGAMGTPSSPNAAAASNSDRSPCVGRPAGQVTGSGGVPVASGVRAARNRQASASAQDSGVRNAGTPASCNSVRDCPASGARNASSGLPCTAEASTIGRTAYAGWNCADEPATHSTASHQSLCSICSTRSRYWAGEAASVRSRIGVWRIFRPRAAMCSMKAVGGATASTSASPSRSTTVAAPPPVVVTTAMRGLRSSAGMAVA
ncbi:hypothetical protein D3C72_1030530 [compost metagenome]